MLLLFIMGLKRLSPHNLPIVIVSLGSIREIALDESESWRFSHEHRQSLRLFRR